MEKEGNRTGEEPRIRVREEEEEMKQERGIGGLTVICINFSIRWLTSFSYRRLSLDPCGAEL